jgi:hypothetical protein
MKLESKVIMMQRVMHSSGLRYLAGKTVESNDCAPAHDRSCLKVASPCGSQQRPDQASVA